MIDLCLVLTASERRIGHSIKSCKGGQKPVQPANPHRLDFVVVVVVVLWKWVGFLPTRAGQGGFRVEKI